MGSLWNWLDNNLIGVLTLIVGAIAAFGSMWGVRIGRRSAAREREAQRIADERYERSVQPRPRLVGSEAAQQAAFRQKELTLDVLNTGGPANRLYIVFKLVGRVYSIETPLPESGVRGVTGTFKAVLQDGGFPDPRPLIMLAEDARGTWWDCGRGKTIEGDPVEWWEAQARINGVAMLRVDRVEGEDYYTFR